MSAGMEIEYGSYYEWSGYERDYDDEDYDDDYGEVPYELDCFREKVAPDWCHKTDCSVEIGCWGLESTSEVFSTVAELEVAALDFADAMKERFDTDGGESAGIHIHIGLKRLSTAISVYDRVNSLSNDEVHELFGRRDGCYHCSAERYQDMYYKFQRSAIRIDFGTYEMRMFASTFDAHQLRSYFLFAKYVEHMFKTNYVPSRERFIQCFTRFKEKICALQS